MAKLISLFLGIHIIEVKSKKCPVVFKNIGKKTTTKSDGKWEFLDNF